MTMPNDTPRTPPAPTARPGRCNFHTTRASYGTTVWRCLLTAGHEGEHWIDSGGLPAPTAETNQSRSAFGKDECSGCGLGVLPTDPFCGHCGKDRCEFSVPFVGTCVPLGSTVRCSLAPGHPGPHILTPLTPPAPTAETDEWPESLEAKLQFYVVRLGWNEQLTDAVRALMVTARAAATPPREEPPGPLTAQQVRTQATRDLCATPGAGEGAREDDLQSIRYALYLTMRHTAAHDAALAALDRLAARRSPEAR